MKKYFSCSLTFGLVLMLCIAVFAQTDLPPELFGVSSFLVTLALGAASSVLITLFKRTKFPEWLKFSIIYGMSFLIAGGAWVFAKQYVPEALTQNLGVTFLAISGAAQGVFVVLKKRVLKPIEKKINPGKPANMQKLSL